MIADTSLVPTILITWDRPPSPDVKHTFCVEDGQPEEDIRSEWKKARPGSRILKIQRNVMADRKHVEGA